jgi:uncharacterized membrane protein YtjA (UPF0391 family)
MLKRARLSALIAIVAALFGFTGIVENTAVIAQSVFYPVAAVTLLSLLLCLFEEKPVHLDARPLTSPTDQH